MRKTKIGLVMGKEVSFEKDDEEGIYNEGMIEILLDDDDLNPKDAAFMKGYDEADLSG